MKLPQKHKQKETNKIKLVQLKNNNKVAEESSWQPI
jgi:hypothetical protein